MTGKFDQLGVLFPPHTSLNPLVTESVNLLMLHWWLIPFCLTWGLIIWVFYTPVDDDVKLKRKIILSAIISCLVWIVFILFVK